MHSAFRSHSPHTAAVAVLLFCFTVAVRGGIVSSVLQHFTATVTTAVCSVWQPLKKFVKPFIFNIKTLKNIKVRFTATCYFEIHWLSSYATNRRWRNCVNWKRERTIRRVRYALLWNGPNNRNIIGKLYLTYVYRRSRYFEGFNLYGNQK
jgi:hypothetical protein